MDDKAEIRRYITEHCEKLTYYEIIEEYIEECYNHHITQNTLRLVTEKLETSRRAVKRLKEQLNGRKSN